MHRFFYGPSVLAVLTCAGAIIPSVTTAADAPPLQYNRDVRPILSDKCFYCHGPDPSHREAGLRLDVEEEAKAYVIDGSDPLASELLARIAHEDPDQRMPPADSGKQLSADEVSIITRWVQQGAPYEPYWAYVPPRRHAVPEVQNQQWPRDTIDRFLLARLEQLGLSPSPDADPVTLIRRVSFDLTGLPPTPQQVDAFVADPSEQAYEQLVDRLLASKAFGERLAVYWLDLVRYADTVGYHGDQEQNISPYRDYVIDSLNANLPFDQFTREQLAGDLLPDPTTDQLIATGYNRLLQTSHEGGVQPKEYLAIYAADRVRNLSSVWLGGTLGCAQCHDHKFDPYTAEDFYSMAAFFADVDEAQHFTKGKDAIPTPRPPELDVHTASERAALAHIEHRIDDLQRQLTTADDAEQAGLQQLLAEWQRQREELLKAARRTMVTVAIEPRPMRVLPRGNWMDDSGPLVQPAIPAFLGQLDTGDRRATRLDLANWLTDSELGAGGLTARVFANRFWYLMFGSGISNSLDDFGGQGQPPVHPELLDNLAVDFVESGWDIKRLFKRLAMTRAYRQASLETPEQRQRDPYNQLFARQSRYRLPAEMVRDNALAISGLLVSNVGGPSIRPYQPDGYYRHLNFPKRTYQHDGDVRQWRRGVYVHWQRQFLHPMLKALDAPSREECTAQRPRSNTPLEALVLLNDPTFVEAARAFAVRILRSSEPSTDHRLDQAFQLALSRSPDRVERETLAALLDQEAAHYAADPAAAARLLENVGQAPVPDDLPATQLAAWTSVARAILNLNETVTRN